MTKDIFENTKPENPEEKIGPKYDDLQRDYIKLNNQHTDLSICHDVTSKMMFYFAGVTVGIIIAHMLLRGD